MGVSKVPTRTIHLKQAPEVSRPQLANVDKKLAAWLSRAALADARRPQAAAEAPRVSRVGKSARFRMRAHKKPAQPLLLEVLSARRCHNNVMTAPHIGASAAAEPLSDAVEVERRQGRSLVPSGCW